MRIAIIGATGRTGFQTLVGAVERGHQVVAVVRNRAKLEAMTQLDVQVVEVSADDADAIARAIDKADAVVSALGHVDAKHPGEVLADGIRATIAAMELTGVRRLVTISASGAYTDGDDPLTRFIAKPILQRFLRESFRDTQQMETIVRASNLDWAIVRPPKLHDGEALGRYKSRTDGNVRWAYRISRADLAAAILDEVEGAGRKRVVSVAN